tara:strand:- start:442 stop:603 length:162 start_codon:yes stop_codon:yes gene_type:complete
MSDNERFKADIINSVKTLEEEKIYLESRIEELEKKIVIYGTVITNLLHEVRKK